MLAGIKQWTLFVVCIVQCFWDVLLVIVVIKDTPVSFGTVRCQLVKEVKLLGLGKLTLHSARIGAATRGAEAGLSRESFKTCGGWRSDPVDGYIRLK